MINRLARLFTIERVFVKYGIEDLFLTSTKAAPLRYFFFLSPTRWLHRRERALPRARRIRLALEELGPVFVKLGQVMSTRRDLLPEDIGHELQRLQDRVPPFAGSVAQQVVEKALGSSVETLFEHFELEPLASASVAQVHAAQMPDGQKVIVKVLRPGIAKIIGRDVSLMYVLADIMSLLLPDGKRYRAREVVEEYDNTIHNELNLVQEASNAVVLRNNFKDSDTLYVPEIIWDYTRTNVLVMERIFGIPIRDTAEMHKIGMDMKKLAEHGVEIFYTQVFRHNFFHADMHPGNIFISPENPQHPQYIAVDFGIVGSLSDEDQRYVGENLLAFFQRDYRRVAQLHVDSGWVPANTRVSELESAVRAVCEPILDKPLAEISFGSVLLQLFQTARRFDMEVQPQLVLLQKTLLNIEGMGRELYPQLDLWATGKPFLERWVMERRGPAALAKRLLEQAPKMLDVMPDMPMLVHEFLQQQSNAARQQSSRGILKEPVTDKRLRYVIVGAALLISTAMIGSAHVVSGSGAPWYAWLVGVLGVLSLLHGLWR